MSDRRTDIGSLIESVEINVKQRVEALVNCHRQNKTA